MSEYMEFLRAKAVKAPERGLKRIPELSGHLFPFQAACVEHHLRVGSAGCFLDTGLGKTEVQLEFCQKGIEATNEPALILTPLAVAGQTKRRAEKYGYEARVIRDQSEARPGIINICNYDRLDKLDPSAFGVVSLDEASVLKSFTGRTTRALIDSFKGVRFKLAATATPAPNDHMELGQYAEFLEIMASNEMLMRWFTADQTQMGKYRLKGHGYRAFWDWMASWSRMAQTPSDLGDSDEGFELPPLEIRNHHAADTTVDAAFGELFAATSMSATTMHDVKRQTSQARAERAAELVHAEPDETRLLWCDTNYEADALKAVLPDAAEVRGAMSIDQKEEILETFATGGVKHLIAKPSMCGFGLDWSHTARMAFVGRSYSYETWYQAVRRCWRFGQKRPVIVDLIVAEGEDTIGRVIDRKAGDHAKMKSAMKDAMRRAVERSAELRVSYNPTQTARVPQWLKSAA